MSRMARNEYIKFWHKQDLSVPLWHMLVVEVTTESAAFEKLDGIIEWAKRKEWPITPLKWQYNPRKTSAELFIEIREAAKMRDRLVIDEHSTRKEARK